MPKIIPSRIRNLSLKRKKHTNVESGALVTLLRKTPSAEYEYSTLELFLNAFEDKQAGDESKVVDEDLNRLRKERKLFSKEIGKDELRYMKWSLGSGSDALVGGSKFEATLRNAWCHPSVSADIRVVIDTRDVAEFGQPVKFYSHRAILSTCSGFFSRTFKRAGVHCKEIVLEKCGNPIVFARVLRWMYTGKIDLGEIRLIEEAFEMAQRLWCPLLLDLINQTLARLLDEGVMHDALLRDPNNEDGDNGDVTPLSPLAVTKSKLAMVAAGALANTDFENLEADHLANLLDDNALIVRSERDVFDAVMQWLDYRPSTRSVFLPQLLKCVRFYNMAPEDMIQTVLDRPEYFQSRGPLQQRLSECLWIQALAKTGRDLAGFEVKMDRSKPLQEMVDIKNTPNLRARYLFLSDIIKGHLRDEESLNDIYNNDQRDEMLAKIQGRLARRANTTQTVIARWKSQGRLSSDLPPPNGKEKFYSENNSTSYRGLSYDKVTAEGEEDMTESEYLLDHYGNQ